LYHYLFGPESLRGIRLLAKQRFHKRFGEVVEAVQRLKHEQAFQEQSFRIKERAGQIHPTQLEEAAEEPDSLQQGSQGRGQSSPRLWNKGLLGAESLSEVSALPDQLPAGLPGGDLE
jgi:hypothetical protein